MWNQVELKVGARDLLRFLNKMYDISKGTTCI